jgi:hypothetical protein
LSAGAIVKQSCHPRHDVAKREVFDHQLVGPKAGSEQANDINGDIGVTHDEIEQIGPPQESHRTVAHRDGIRWLGLAVKRGDIGKGSARSEDFQDLLTTLLRRRLGPHSSTQHAAKPFGPIALAKIRSPAR